MMASFGQMFLKDLRNIFPKKNSQETPPKQEAPGSSPNNEKKFPGFEFKKLDNSGGSGGRRRRWRF